FTDLSVKEAGKSAIQGQLFMDSGAGDETENLGDIANINSAEHHYELVDTPEKRRDLVAMLGNSGIFCFDTETTDIDPQKAELVGMSFSLKPGEAFFISLPENYDETRNIVNEFKSVFGNPAISKVGQNIKYDISMLKWYDAEVKGSLFDTMIAHYLLQPDMRHNMDVLAETYLRYKPVSYDELTEKNRGRQLPLRQVQKNKISSLVDYACEDADITLQLKNIFEPELEKTGTLKLFDEIEMPLIPVLASMEAEGVKIDIPVLLEYSSQLEKEISGIEKEIHAQAGQKFNIASPKQLGEILFEKLNITDNPRKTKTRQYSTAEDVLQKLVNKHSIIQNILDYRSLTKLKSTYVDILPTMVNPRTGRIHTSYNQAVAATGRLSSDKPNLQNIPIRTERGREIRKAFIPRNDKYILLSADYSQIELRIIAEISEDQSMIEAFRQGVDIHSSTASKVYNVSLPEVTKEMRRNAKMVNFGIVYGISAFGLSERLNIPRNEAKFIIDQYFEKYPGIKKFMNDTINTAREKGYVETIRGRRRYIRDINSANAVVRGFAERNAINAPIQGSSADMIKIAMINIHKTFEEKGFKSKMILQVHDELVFDVYKEEIEKVKPVILELMKTAIPLKVPVEVEISLGENWLEAH
ncbi:MAG: DNA polymerase I, partial [Bacteroidetes bacterium]|nr:DNA polymerase I [Bacteroidota bacterium]